jgi:aldehyde dehydrogenase (NAD+)
MKQFPHLYIDGRWTEPIEPRNVELVDPTREEVFARVAMGTAADADLAVAAAQRAFESFSATSVDERIALIDRIIDVYETYIDEFSDLIAREVGIPVVNRAQVTGPADHMRVARDIIRDYPFESRMGSAIVRREPIGVCAVISPWNWPIQTGVIKTVYALAAGCTVVAKPSVNSAASGTLMAQVLHEADVPPGVFNLVNGAGCPVIQAWT